MRRRLWVPLAGALLALGAAAAVAPGARLQDVYPREGMVQPGQAVHLELQVDRPWYDPRPVEVTITRGLSTTPVAVLKAKGGTLAWTPPEAGGYGVTARLGKSQASTAIDVGASWTERPRYGFLSDFSPHHAGQADRFATMARFHLNGLQFYDWMYRHHDYLPPTAEFRDPLGRLMSRDVIQEKLALARRHGMASMAYTAVYAAPKEFYEAHKDWGLYDASGRVYKFGNEFLYIMNPEPGGPWARHIVSEFGKIVRELPFDGIHLDQYGDPRYGYRFPGGPSAQPVDVASAVAAMIDATKAEVGPGKAVVFNDVGGWPLVDTAPTTNDFIYIEVWPPHVHFEHLRELIDRGRRLSSGKPVVLAAYISPAFAPSVLLTDAVIFANGGYHLEIGEGDAMLQDPYFPKYRRMDPELSSHLRRYYDVTVRYQELLYGRDLNPWEPEVTIENSRVLGGGYFNGVWPVGRQNERHAVLHLINLNGLEDAKWNSPRLQPPALLQNRQVTVEMGARPKALYLIDPDGPDQSPRTLTFTYQDGTLSFSLERLAYWAMLVIER